jgi:hypothetical protein
VDVSPDEVQGGFAEGFGHCRYRANIGQAKPFILDVEYEVFNDKSKELWYFQTTVHCPEVMGVRGREWTQWRDPVSLTL